MLHCTSIGKYALDPKSTLPSTPGIIYAGIDLVVNFKTGTAINGTRPIDTLASPTKVKFLAGVGSYNKGGLHRSPSAPAGSLYNLRGTIGTNFKITNRNQIEYLMPFALNPNPLSLFT